MSDAYCIGCVELEFNADQRELVQAAVDRVVAEADAGDMEGYWNEVHVGETNVVIENSENFEIDQAIRLVQELLHTLNQGPKVISWAYTCSRLRPNEHGGGAAIVFKDRDAIVVDAQQLMADYLGKVASPDVVELANVS